MGILERIKDIEDEIARTQKNKATEYHIGLLKGKLAKLRSQLINDASSGKGGKGEGFDVEKSGNARVAMIGFPSVGKSTLLSSITATESEAASYAFTTLTAIPGVIEYNGARIQLVDLPGIIEGASEGKGRGKQVIAAARTSDLVLMMLDAGKGDVQRRLLEKELESVGIRLNCSPADVVVRRKKTGGITFNSTIPLTKCSEKWCKDMLQLHKIHNVDVLFREDATMDEFIDIIEGNRKYMNCLYVYNKIDTITLEEIDRLAHQPHSVVISCNWDLNLDFLIERIWDALGLVRVYTKRRGEYPDIEEPVLLRRDRRSVRHLCQEIHKTLVDEFRYALVWGRSAKHDAQRVGLAHLLTDEDVVQISK